MKVVRTAGQVPSLIGFPASEEDSESSMTISKSGSGNTEPEPPTLTLMSREKNDHTGT